jgi:hypothetical protein
MSNPSLKQQEWEARVAEQPTPMNLDDYLLSHLAQECNEVAIRCTKAQMFGLDEIQPEQPLTNRQRIAEELADLQALVVLMEDVHLLPEFSERDLNARISAKHRKAKEFRNYSRQLGRLEQS